MQIAWITDIYRHGGFRYGFITSYCLYVTFFFPYVISGPIAYHKEVDSVTESEKSGIFNAANYAADFSSLPSVCLKKTAIADTLAAIIANGDLPRHHLEFFTDAWLTSFSFTMQLYF